MEAVFTLATLAGGVAMILGLVKPGWVMWWRPRPTLVDAAGLGLLPFLLGSVGSFMINNPEGRAHGAALLVSFAGVLSIAVGLANPRWVLWWVDRPTRPAAAGVGVCLFWAGVLGFAMVSDPEGPVRGGAAAVLLAGLGVIVVGLVNPRWVLRWVDEPTRPQAVVVGVVMVLAGFIGFGLVSAGDGPVERGIPTADRHAAAADHGPAPVKAPSGSKSGESNSPRPAKPTPVRDRVLATAPAPSEPRTAEDPPSRAAQPGLARLIAPPSSNLAPLTVAGGVGDSAARLHANHQPTSGSGTVPPRFDADGSMAFGAYDRNYVQVTAIRNVVQSVTLQLELRRSLPKQAALEAALRYAPKDRRTGRRFRDSLHNDVFVYHSPQLAKRLPDAGWYGCDPVGTFSVVLQRTEGARDYFGVRVFTGVEEDEADPDSDKPCANP